MNFIRQSLKDNLFCRAYGERKRENILSKAYRSLVLDLSRNITAISLLLRLRLVLFCYGYGYFCYGYYGYFCSLIPLLFCLHVLFVLLITLFRLAISSFFKFRLSFSAFPQIPAFPSRVFALLFVFVFLLKSQKRNFVTRRTAEIAEEKKR